MRRLRASDFAMAAVGVGWSVVVVIAAVSWLPEREVFDWVAPWPGLLAQAGLGATLLVRRLRPLTVLAVALLASVGMLGGVLLGTDPELAASAVSAETTLFTPAITPFVTYAAVVYSDRHARTWALVLGLTALVARPWAFDVTVATTAAAFVALPALLGLYVAARRRLITALTERAERAEREQRLLADQARAEERTRLAEEMHDAVTERVNHMLDLAAQLGDEAPTVANREAASGLTEAGQQALEELHDLVGVLRTGASPTTPDPPVALAVPDLDQLIAESRAVGMVVTLREEGNAGALSPTVERTAYRIVQEALTNVRKHAARSRVEVTVRYAGDRVRISVHNTAPADARFGAQRSDPVLPSSGSGTGLLGLRQRVELVDGTLHAEPTETGGFAVDAILPAYVPTSAEPARRGAVPSP